MGEIIALILILNILLDMADLGNTILAEVGGIQLGWLLNAIGLFLINGVGLLFGLQTLLTNQHEETRNPVVKQR